MPRDPYAPRSTAPASPMPDSMATARRAGVSSVMEGSAGPRAGGLRGTWLVAGLLLLGVAAAVGAILFQRQQTRECLAFYGPAAARRITSAAGVELLAVQPGGGPRRLAVSSRLDVSQAPGLVHLRRGLVEDANFSWSERFAENDPRGDVLSGAPRPLDRWDAALVFTDRDGGGQTTLVVDLDATDGALAVVGQPGWIGLGRIGRGLDAWIRATWSRDAGDRDAGERAAENRRRQAE